MSPSPSSQSQASKTQPTTLQRQSTARRRTPTTETPEPIQATSASIYSHSRHEEDDGDDQDPRDPRKLKGDEDDHEEDDRDDRDEAIEDDDEYLEPDEEDGTSLLPPPNFQPFFALITDPATQETHHPHVYYVFSDDAETEREGHDVATVASLRALDQTAQSVQRQPGQAPKNVAADDELEERYIILDLDAAVAEDGSSSFSVSNVTSLSPAWAVTSARLEPAPTFEEERPETDQGALMLLLEGIELAEAVPGVGKKNKNAGKTKIEEAENRASDVLAEARKRGSVTQGVNGTLLQGMDEVWRSMSERMIVLEKVLGDEREKEERQ